MANYVHALLAGSKQFTAMNENKYIRLLKNSGLVFIGNIGSKLLIFLLLPFYTRWLSPEEYGSADLIMTYVTLVMAPLFCCISDAIFIFPFGQPLQKQRAYFTSGLMFCGGMFLLGICACLILWNLLSHQYFFIQHLPALLLLSAAQISQAYMQQFARSLNRMGVFVLSGLVMSVSVFALSFILVSRYKVLGIILANGFSCIVSCAVTFVILRAWRYLGGMGDWSESLRSMLRYSIMMVPNALMWWISASLSKPVLKMYCSPEILGFYAFSVKIASMIAISGQILSVAWQASVFEEFPKDGYRVFYNRIIPILLLLQCLGAFLVGMGSRYLLPHFVDARYADSWQYIVPLAFSSVIAWHAGYVGVNFQVTKRGGLYILSAVCGVFFNIIAVFALVPYCGIIGAITANAGGNFVILLVRIYLSSSIVRMDCLPVSAGILAVFTVLAFLIYAPRYTAAAVSVQTILLLALLVYLFKKIITEGNLAAMKQLLHGIQRRKA